IYAHDLALEIEQRAARITGIDGDVGLDERYILVAVQHALLRGNDARGHGCIEAERRADGQHPGADFELVRVADGDGRQVFGIDLQYRYVTVFVGPDHRGNELAPVRQLDDDTSGIANHMAVGE